MFLPSQLPTETDVIDWNNLELKYEMALHPAPAVTNGNCVLPDIPSKRSYIHHRMLAWITITEIIIFKYVLALWISPDLSVVSRTVYHEAYEFVYFSCTVFPCTIHTSNNPCCDCASLQTVAHMYLRENFKTEKLLCSITCHSFIFLKEWKHKGHFE